LGAILVIENGLTSANSGCNGFIFRWVETFARGDYDPPVCVMALARKWRRLHRILPPHGVE
jgi:hypothetical protein